MKKLSKDSVIFFWVSIFGILLAVSISSLVGGESVSSSYSEPTVTNSSLDASVYQVKSFIKQNAKDPKSVKYLEWSNVIENSSGNYTVRVKYRAKNSFGGLTTENKLATLDSKGNVIGFKDFF